MVGFRVGGFLGGAFDKILANKILLSPKRENMKCPKALPSFGLLEFGVHFLLESEAWAKRTSDQDFLIHPERVSWRLGF